MEKNKTNRYLKYAVGEIVLVVIGILIALQINNWNVDRINVNTSRVYLANMKEELSIQISHLNRVYLDRFERKMNKLNLGKKYYEQPFKIEDTGLFISQISYGAVASVGIEQFNQSVFESLKSTGQIGLIERELRNKIMIHYDRSNLITSLSEKGKSNYQDLMNSLRPFDPLSPEHVSKTDQIRFIEVVKTEEFIRQVNLELSNANHNFGRINGVMESANDLILSIENYLNDF